MVVLAQLENQVARRKRVRSPAISIAVGIGVLTWAGVMVSPSPLVVLVSGAFALLAILCLWRSDEPPILLVPIFMQFVAISTKPITTAITGVPLQDISDFDNNLEPAVLFALAALAALVLALRLTVYSGHPAASFSIQAWSYRRILVYSLLALVAGHALDVLSNWFSEVRQILLALTGIKWAGLFVLTYATLSMRRGWGWLAGVVLFELILGMTGFFAQFQEVIFVTLAAIISARIKFRISNILLVTIGTVLAGLLAIFWTSIKQDYRDFMSAGTSEQVVMQPLDERIKYLANKVVEFDVEQFNRGFNLLLQRISYIDFLAATMERVPAVIPYENGNRMGAVLVHVLTPRVLFPDKPDLPNDTAVTAYYAGVDTAGLGEGSTTSISIGYLGEMYVDFGIAGSLLAVFLVGLVYGRGYRAVRDYNRLPTFLNYGFCMILALPLTGFGTALIKLFGSTITLFAAVFLLQRIILPSLLIRNVRHEFGKRNLRPWPKV